MTTHKKIAISIAAAFLLSIGTMAFADSSGSAGDGSGVTQGTPQHRHHHHWKRMKAVIQACAQANKITLPAKGSGEHLTAAERSDIHACAQTFRQDFRSCVQNAGITRPEPGQKPSAADIAAFKQCRADALKRISAN